MSFEWRRARGCEMCVEGGDLELVADAECVY